MPVNAPRVIDLFCGAGGMSLGFRAAGCRILAGIDEDDAANATYLDNFTRLQPDNPPIVPSPGEGDLHSFDLESIPGVEGVDIVIGGPPCQGFSRIGRAKIDSLRDEGQREEGFEEDPRNELYKIFLSAVRRWQPRAFVMENVPGMLSIGGQNMAEDIGGDLADSGYRVGYAVLNAVWYGVPQFRERLFFIGVRNDLAARPAMPPASHRSATMPSGYFTTANSSRSSQLPAYLPFIMHYDLDVNHGRAKLSATSVQEALDDLPRLEDHLNEGHLPRGDFRRPLPYPRPPHSAFAMLMRCWPGLVQSSSVVDHVIRRTRRDYDTFGLMQPGDRYPQVIAIATERVRRKFRERLDGIVPEDNVDALARLLEEFEQARKLGTPFKEWSAELVSFAREIFPPYPEDKFVDKWRKLVPGEPSWTVTAHLSKDSYSHIHFDGTQKRAISVREAARLQSFPDSFAFSGNMGDCYRQIGNAVPPLMAWAIAHTVLALLGEDATLPPFA
ncbi:DNA cytosine methyltransferase [Tundrisphaera lichenicola]|uniref:DNA cytosine methyltransferase n=1 Tax=Tundrisphaera lichenicola TaxID=2029860 RepID=UPI003EBAB3A4